MRDSRFFVYGESLIVQNQAAEIRLRAERKAGSMLAEMDGKGSHGGDRKSSNTMLLEDLGITKMQSSRWQAEAAVSDERFDEWVAEMNESDGELRQLEGIVTALERQAAVKWNRFPRRRGTPFNHAFPSPVQ